MKIIAGLIICIASLLMTSCNKHHENLPSVTKIYTLDLKQIKDYLNGNWYVNSECNTTIAGTDCRTPEFEVLSFTANDSLIWVRDNEIYKKEKIRFSRIEAPKSQGYTVDSLYIFELEESKRSFFPYEIKNDSLIFISPTQTKDAGFRMVLTRFTTSK